MRALVWTGPGNLEMQERPVPDPGPDELLIQSKAIGVCGTDRHIFDGHFAAAVPPLILGHEAAGVVYRTGSNIGGFNAGDRVLINPELSCGQCLFCLQGDPHQCLQREGLGMTTKDGAFADFFLAPAQNAFALPDSLSWEDAAAIDPLACAIHALNLAPQRAGQSVAIFGAGPSGLCFLQLCRLSGASKIIVLDLIDRRLVLARELGAHEALNAKEVDSPNIIRQLTDGLGVDLAIEASGALQAVPQCIKATRNRGKVLIYGVYSSPVDGVDFQDQHRREITIYGSSGAPESYPTAIELVQSRQIDVRALVSDRIRLADLPRFLDDSERRRNCLKAVVLMEGQ